MSMPVVLAWLSPLLLLIAVAGVVFVVALTQAAEADVPAVFDRCGNIITALCRRLPFVRAADTNEDSATDDQADADDDHQVEDSK